MGSRGAMSGRKLNATGVRKLEKSNRTLQRVIEQHISYIENPKQKYEDWDTFTEGRKQREIRHWQKEINAMSAAIEQNKKRMEEHKNG